MSRLKMIFTFILGFTIGAVLGILLFFTKNYNSNIFNNNNNTPIKNNEVFHKSSSFLLPKKDFKIGYNYKKYDVNDIKMPNLFKKKVFKPNYNSNILCVIFSSDLSNSFAASKSWAKHCNNFKFFAMDDGNTDIGNLKYLNVTILKPKHSWDFLCNSILQLYKLYRKTLQWVIFVHDNVFVIPENLRYYVIYKDYNKPYYLGDLSYFWSIYYNTAEAGFVLSKGAIKLLTKKFNSTKQCEISGKHWKAEDYYLGLLNFLYLLILVIYY